MLLKTVLHVFLLKSKLLFLVSKNSELKGKFLFKNKATKSSKNVPSLDGNVDWVCLGCNVVVGDCIGGNFVPGEKLWWRSLLLAMSQSEQVWLAVFQLGFERVVML